ncbi:MAG: CAP domain-containing protein, partial [Acidimicrobiia bacterium]
MALINAERQSRGLTPYSSQGQLQAAARSHGTDMACNDFFSHTGSDGSSVRDRVSAQGYAWSWVGENLFAGGSASPQSAFDWWMLSPPHQANLMNSNYTDIGIGYIYEPNSLYKGYFTAV